MRTKCLHIIDERGASSFNSSPKKVVAEKNESLETKVEHLFLSEEEALSLLKDTILTDEVVALPSETVYGLAADIKSEMALKKIFELKKRPADNPLIIHLASLEKLLSLTAYANDINFQLENYPTSQELLPLLTFLFNKFCPGPLTFILPRNDEVSDLVTASLPTAAFRVPAHPLFLQLLTKYDLALAAPSANLSGRPSPTCVEHVLADFSPHLKMALNGGSSQEGVESTVISFAKYKDNKDKSEIVIKILRPGAITKRDLSLALKEYEATRSEDLFNTSKLKIEEIAENNSPKKEQKVESPGLKYRHYSPKSLVKPYIWQENYCDFNIDFDLFVADFLEQIREQIKVEAKYNFKANDESNEALFFSLEQTSAKDELLTCAFFLPSFFKKSWENLYAKRPFLKKQTYFFESEEVEDRELLNERKSLLYTLNLVKGAQKNLFSALRCLDEEHISFIFVPSFKQIKEDLIINQAKAYQNRLAKASLKYRCRGDRWKKIEFVCTANTCRSPLAEYYFRWLVEKKKDELQKTLKEMDTLSEDKIILLQKLSFLRNIEISSSGLAAFTGDGAASSSIYLARKNWDIDLEKHRSKRTSLYSLEDKQNLILTMTENQARYLSQKYFPELEEKIEDKKEAREEATAKYIFFEDKFSLDSDETCRKNIFSLLEFLHKIAKISFDKRATREDLDIQDPFAQGLEAYSEMANDISLACESLLDYLLSASI